MLDLPTAPVPLDISTALARYAETIHPDDLLDPDDLPAPELVLLDDLLDGADPIALAALLTHLPPITITLGEVVAYRKDDHDLLTVEVESEGLEALYDLLVTHLPWEDDPPAYDPHVRLAELRKGRGGDYAGDDRFDGITLTLGQAGMYDATGQRTGTVVLGGRKDPGLPVVRKSWTQFQGPRGGRGWKNNETGRVLYQEENPEKAGEQTKPDFGETGKFLQHQADQFDKKADSLGLDVAEVHRAAVEHLHRWWDAVKDTPYGSWGVGQKELANALESGYQFAIQKQLVEKDKQEKAQNRKPLSPAMSARSLATAVSDWADTDDSSDPAWAKLSDADRERMASTLASQPAVLFRAIGEVNYLNPQEGDDEAATAVRDVLRRAVAAAPSAEKKQLTIDNIEEAYYLDLSSATPEGLEDWNLLSRLVPHSDALTGRKVRVVFRPRGVRDDAFSDILNAVTGGNTADMVGKYADPEGFYEGSIAPEQVAVHHVPRSARGLDQTDAEHFHADNVPTYKRISRNLWVVRDTSGDHEYAGPGDVPHLIALPKHLLDRSRPAPVLEDEEELGKDEVAEAARGRRQRKEEAQKERAGQKEERRRERFEAQQQDAFNDVVDAWSDFEWLINVDTDDEGEEESELSGDVEGAYDAMMEAEGDDIPEAVRNYVGHANRAVAWLRGRGDDDTANGLETTVQRASKILHLHGTKTKSWVRKSWVRKQGERGGSLWVNSETGKEIYSKEDPNKKGGEVGQISDTSYDGGVQAKTPLGLWNTPTAQRLDAVAEKLGDRIGDALIAVERGEWDQEQAGKYVSYLSSRASTAAVKSIENRGNTLARWVIGQMGDRAKKLDGYRKMRDEMHGASLRTMRAFNAFSEELSAPGADREKLAGAVAKLQKELKEASLDFNVGVLALRDELAAFDEESEYWEATGPLAPHDAGFFPADDSTRDPADTVLSDDWKQPEELSGIQFGRPTGYLFQGKPLPKATAQAVSDYADKGYRHVNQHLRYGGIDDDEDATRTAKRIHKHLKGLFSQLQPSDKPVNAYRGLSLHPQQVVRLMKQLRVAHETGEPVRFAGYSSTTLNPAIAFGYAEGGKDRRPGGSGTDVLFEIAVRKGLNIGALSADDHREGQWSEDELLLDHNTPMRVAGIRTVKFKNPETEQVEERTVVQLVQEV